MERSEIRVECVGNFLATTCGQVVEQVRIFLFSSHIILSSLDHSHLIKKSLFYPYQPQISDSFQDRPQRHRIPAYVEKRPLQLPLDSSISDGESDISTPLPTGAAHRGPESYAFHEMPPHKHRSCVEISPTDSAFEDLGSPDPSHRGGRLSMSLCCSTDPFRGSECSGHFSDTASAYWPPASPEDVTERSTTTAFRYAGNPDDPDYEALQAQPWWESNWSLHSDATAKCGVEKRESYGGRFVPMVVPVPNVPMKPRIGYW